MEQSFTPLYDSDISSIAAASKHTTPSNALNVQGSKKIAVHVKAAGENASIAGDVDVRFIASVDGTNFDTQVFSTLTLTKTDTASERATAIVEVEGVHSIKVLEIENKDATYAVQDVNVYIGRLIN